MDTVTGAQLKGLDAISIADGERLGKVVRTYVHRRDLTVVGFGVDPGHHWFEPESALLIDVGDLTSLGSDVLTVADRTAIRGEQIARSYEDLVEIGELSGRSVMTETGERLGSVAEVLIDPKALRLTQLSLSVGRRGSPRPLPIDRVRTLGADVAIVSAADGRQPLPDSADAAREHDKREVPMNDGHLNGLAVVSITDGEKVGTISRVLLDLDKRRIVGLEVMSGGGLLTPTAGAWFIEDKDVHAIGPDAVTIPERSVLREGSPASADVPMTAMSELNGRKVVTEGGTYVGTVAAIDFDEQSRRLTSLEVSPGFFKSKRMVPFDQVVNPGGEIVVVADAVCEDADQSEPGGESDDRRLVVGDIEPTRSDAVSG